MENKKSLFDKVMDHSLDLTLLGMVGVYVASGITSIVSYMRSEKQDLNERSNRIENIKELQANGANVDINLEGDI